MENDYGCICYSITGESNAGDSRPASAKPTFHTGKMTDIYGDSEPKKGTGKA